MRNFWAYRLLGGDALSIVPVGLKEHSSGQRSCCIVETGAADSFSALIA
jgi:hypothetical protein